MSAKEEVRSRIDFEAVVRRYVHDLRQVGGDDLVAPCPFHRETKGSFHLHPQAGYFHCFGCQASGDLFTFYGRINGLEFNEALQALAEEAGVVLTEKRDPKAEEEDRRRRQLVIDCQVQHQIAQRHFRANLAGLAGAGARDYLAKRGISPEMAELFGLGYSLDSWNGLKNELSDPLAGVESGLLIQPEDRQKRSYDRFRGRLMFPIANMAGQVIAFGGRIMEEGDPKYLNSSDSPIYKKGDQLYGLYQARPNISKSKRIILTEGYMDVITLHQFGYPESVGVLGTALTIKQVRRIKNLAESLVIVFDGDDAGRKAALRASEICLSQSLPCSVVSLPQGEDIDSLLRQSGCPEAFQMFLATAQDSLDYCMARLKESRNPEKALEWALGLLKRLKDPGWGAGYVDRLAAGLGLNLPILEQLVIARVLEEAPQRPAPAPVPASVQSDEDPEEQKDRGYLKLALQFLDRAAEMDRLGLGQALTSGWGIMLWGKLKGGDLLKVFGSLSAEDRRFVEETQQALAVPKAELDKMWPRFKAALEKSKKGL